MPLHKDLTEAELHETKGASTASADTVLVADGAGATSFIKIGRDNVDLTTVVGWDVVQNSFNILNPGVAFDIYIPIEANKTLNYVHATIGGVVTGATLSIEIVKNATVIDTLSFPITVTAGTTDSMAIPTALLTTDTLHVRTTAAGVTAAANITFLFTYTY